MKVFFLTIALSLFSILQAEESTSSGEVLGGTYYINAVVADTEFPEDERPKALSPVTISFLNDGNVEASFTVRKDGKCKEIKGKLEKTDNPNEFTIDEGRYHVYVTKTSAPDSWILLFEGEFKGKQVKVVKLLGPNAEVDPEALNEYQEFIREKGFNERRVISPEQEEACTPEDA
ncbi:late lactation protein B-like [Trichosurus vulpecula]|uniref:late lactation protein B-like n=1 Tax=Trichosurus vulpecula TaxID=9337 RepID=UPI00186ADEC4|nr:late lactation protein B-like [Trichosurus vulpecula]